jgi:hypothetical protein
MITHKEKWAKTARGDLSDCREGTTRPKGETCNGSVWRIVPCSVGVYSPTVYSVTVRLMIPTRGWDC